MMAQQKLKSEYQSLVNKISRSRLLSEKEKKDYIHYLPNMKYPQIERLRSIFAKEDKIDWNLETKLYRKYEEDVGSIIRDGQIKICRAAERAKKKEDEKKEKEILSGLKNS